MKKEKISRITIKIAPALKARLLTQVRADGGTMRFTLTKLISESLRPPAVKEEKNRLPETLLEACKLARNFMKSGRTRASGDEVMMIERAIAKAEGN